MWRFIGFLILLIASVWLGLLIAKDPGLAFFSYREWSVEMPLWFAMFALFFLFLTVYLIIRLLTGMESLYYRLNNWRRWRRRNRAYSKTNRGLVELIEEHWKVAERYLLDGMRQSDAQLINYLALAKAAHEQGAYERRDAYLRKAHASSPEADLVIGLTQARFQLQQGQLEQALATLKHLQTIAPNEGAVLKLLERVYIHLGDWTNLLKLLPNLYRYSILNREQYTLLEKRIYLEKLNSYNTSDKTQTNLQELWSTVPRKLRKDPEIIHAYANQMLKYPDNMDELEPLIYKSLKNTWNEKLVNLYGNLLTKNEKTQLNHAEYLLKRYPNQAALLLVLGKICARCQLWGKARRYYEESLSLGPNIETFTEYGKLLEKLDDQTAAMQSYRDGLILVGQKS